MPDSHRFNRELLERAKFVRSCFIAACLGFGIAACPPGFADTASNFNDYSQAFDTSALTASQDSSVSQDGGGGMPGTTAATGDQSHESAPAVKPSPQSDNSPPKLAQTYNGNIANGSVNLLPVPSGQWSFGFTGGVPASVASFWSKGGFLPPTSTSSVELNITE